MEVDFFLLSVCGKPRALTGYALQGRGSQRWREPPPHSPNLPGSLGWEQVHTEVLLSSLCLHFSAVCGALLGLSCLVCEVGVVIVSTLGGGHFEDSTRSSVQHARSGPACGTPQGTRPALLLQAAAKCCWCRGLSLGTRESPDSVRLLLWSCCPCR